MKRVFSRVLKHPFTHPGSAVGCRTDPDRKQPAYLPLSTSLLLNILKGQKQEVLVEFLSFVVGFTAVNI